jgi:hypothetical protein
MDTGSWLTQNLTTKPRASWGNVLLLPDQEDLDTPMMRPPASRRDRRSTKAPLRVTYWDN